MAKFATELRFKYIYYTNTVIGVTSKFHAASHQILFSAFVEPSVRNMVERSIYKCRLTDVDFQNIGFPQRQISEAPKLFNYLEVHNVK